MKAWCTGVLLLTLAGLSGCMGPLGRGRQMASGKASLEDAASALQTQVQSFEPTQINGMCKLGYRDEEGKWRKLPSFNMKLWLEPPYNLCLQSTAVSGPEGKIFLGANQEEFWLSIKPEINTYWYGRWDDVPDVTTLELNPRVVLESLGMIEFAPHETWRLENQKGLDVLTCTDTVSARVIKRLFVTTKSYQLAKIIYYNDLGDPAVVVDLERYRVLDGRNPVPTGIRVTRYGGGHPEGRVTFNLTQGVLRQFTDKTRARMFQPVTPTGYDQVIHVTRFGSILE
ncbi:MAG: hypothetical protein K9N55_01110 [Phycisphaerae bacterium]|nr:hypothetical protein [Phycisphaerae bacterium]